MNTKMLLLALVGLVVIVSDANAHHWKDLRPPRPKDTTSVTQHLHPDIRLDPDVFKRGGQVTVTASYPLDSVCGGFETHMRVRVFEFAKAKDVAPELQTCETYFDPWPAFAEAMPAAPGPLRFGQREETVFLPVVVPANVGDDIYIAIHRICRKGTVCEADYLGGARYRYTCPDAPPMTAYCAYRRQ